MPVAKDLFDRADQMQQRVYLVDGLADERAAAFAGPATLYGPRIVLRRAVPLHIRIGLQDFSQPSRRDGALQEEYRVVKAVLADHAELNSGMARHGDHARGRCGSDGHRLLHQHMLFVARAQLNRGQPVAGKGAYVEKVDVSARCELFGSGNKLSAPGLSKLAAALRGAIRARGELIADILVSLRVLAGNGAGADDCNSHEWICSVRDESYESPS